MTRVQGFLLSAIFAVCTGLVAASHLVTGTPSHRAASTQVLAGIDSLSDMVAGTYSRDEEVRPRKVAAKAQKKGSCDPTRQTCVAAGKLRAPKLEAVTFKTGYRTLCVRLCDGYYFPISSATSPEHFQQDSLDCQSRCTSPSRLFVYKNDGGSAETMVDLDGRPYSALGSAFLYRTGHNPACTCKADPWTEEAANKHRIYALEDAQRAGHADAERRLALMRSIVRRQVSDARQRSGAGDLAPVIRDGGIPDAGIAPQTVALVGRAAVSAPSVGAVTEAERDVRAAASDARSREAVTGTRTRVRSSGTASRKAHRASPNERNVSRPYNRYAAYRGW